jgi:uncharacterized protein
MSEEQPEDFGPTPLEPPPEREPFWGYFELGIFAGMAVPCTLVGFLTVSGAFRILHFKPTNKLFELLPGQALGYLLLFGVLAILFRLHDRPFWKSLAWRPPSISPVAIVAAGMAAALFVAIFGSLIHTPNTANPMTELMKGRVSLILMAAFGVTVGPLCEELAFRGFLQPLLVRSIGPIPGIFAAAIPFGLLHFQEYGYSWRHALLISVAGAAFGWMRYATGSTSASTLMHSAYNAFVFVAFVAKGTQ